MHTLNHLEATTCAQVTSYSSQTLKLQASSVSTYFSTLAVPLQLTSTENSGLTTYLSTSTVHTKQLMSTENLRLTTYLSTSAVPTELTLAENLGLTVGAAAGASVLLVVTISIFCIILLRAISQKKRSRLPGRLMCSS